MHIVFVTGFFMEAPWEIVSGGMPGYIVKITGLLQQRGHQVEIVCGARDDRTWVYNGVTVHNCFWYGNMFAGFWGVSQAVLRRDISIQKRLKEINRKDTVDIVQYAGWSGVGCLHSLECPSVLRLSTYSKIQYRDNEMFKDYAAVYSFWERMAARRATSVISPSRIMASCLERDIKRKIAVVETPYIQNEIEDNKEIISLIPQGPYFLFCGTASKDKGFDVISDMCVRFFSYNPQMSFVFAGWDVGTGKESAVRKLKERLGDKRDRFVYLGQLEKEKLYPVMRRADMVLIPSRIDNFPNVCLEAMSFERIVIGTLGSSLDEIIKDNINGFLVKPGDSLELMDAVNRVISLSDEEKKGIKENIRKSLERFNADRCIELLENIYVRLIKSNGRKLTKE